MVMNIIPQKKIIPQKLQNIKILASYLSNLITETSVKFCSGIIYIINHMNFCYAASGELNSFRLKFTISY